MTNAELRTIAVCAMNDDRPIDIARDDNGTILSHKDNEVLGRGKTDAGAIVDLIDALDDICTLCGEEGARRNRLYSFLHAPESEWNGAPYRAHASCARKFIADPASFESLS